MGRILLLLLVSSSSFAKDAKDTYLDSCKGNYIIALSPIYGEERKREIKDITFICNKISTQKIFDKMADPMFQGCYDTMFFVSEKIGKSVTKLRVDNCADLNGR